MSQLVQCPECKFANRVGQPHCLMCKTALPAGAPAAQRPAPPSGPRPARPGAPGGPRPGSGRPGPPSGQRPRPSGPEGTQRMLRPDAGAPPRRPGPPSGAAPRRPGPPSGAPPRPAPPPQIDPADILGWLCCDPLPPIPLGPKPTLTVGRSDKCDLVLPHKEVSRVHALIKVRASAKMVVIEDEGSSNGTFVNGKRAPSSLLREGDVVAIGPYEIMVRSAEEMSRRKDDSQGDSTNNFELTSVARVLPSAAMTGLLQEVPMTEVLQGIEFNKKNGTLSVTTTDRRTGVMVFSQGQPMYAGFGELRDDEAVLAMITLRAGSFAITADVEPGERRMRSSLTGLLLEASRREDEGHDELDAGLPDAPEDDDYAQGFASEETEALGEGSPGEAVGQLFDDLEQ